MAKTVGPLMSMSASGKFADSIVFQKNGRARVWCKPANPQTVDQVAWRTVYKEIQKSLKLLGTKVRVELKSGFGATWNSMIVGELTADKKSRLDAYVAEFTAFQVSEKSAWATADASAPSVLADGAPLYACASAIYDMAARLGVTVTLTLPVAANATAVGAEWVANNP